MFACRFVPVDNISSWPDELPAALSGMTQSHVVTANYVRQVVLVWVHVEGTPYIPYTTLIYTKVIVLTHAADNVFTLMRRHRLLFVPSSKHHAYLLHDKVYMKGEPRNICQQYEVERM